VPRAFDSYPLYYLLAKEAVRFEVEDQEGHEIGKEGLNSPSHVRPQEYLSQVLAGAHYETGYDYPGNAVDPTDYEDGATTPAIIQVRVQAFRSGIPTERAAS